jgi:hypothetical protein
MGGRVVPRVAETGCEAESGVGHECGVCCGGGVLFDLVCAECVGLVGCGVVCANAVGVQFDGWDAGGGGGAEVAEWGFVQ